MKRFLMLFICLCLCAGLFPITAAAAPEWPSDVSIQADAGIVMDSDTGTVKGRPFSCQWHVLHTSAV